ncbi:MAG: Fis family transcriptional regulator [Gammaproteobacteria bacterium HGW-Gammaproteobacteria-3]|jgi:sigma-54-specific transcriptional regulator|nr:MAG: Fis family transcriptional regulator [Gammaproteobacteria bacterium HGW-Gammaproteobacteria-3]
MNSTDSIIDPPLITFPEPHAHATSIRATALVFSDPASRHLLDYIERIAPSEATVLVIGETGTGKELIARHVHALSQRRNKPFVAINCGAFSETLIESELFGHERGAFTGAQTARAGWFETANGGTLFLDEIGDLPVSAQVKLLRVLQEREVLRIGAREATAIDVRLIAATNVDLAAAVQSGHFREDLYYRLNVAGLTLLPLRERPGDILPLVQFFLKRYSKRLEISDAALTQSAETALLNYSWPGNIRELENVIHHSLLLSKSNIITTADLHLHQNPGQPITRSGPSGSLEKAAVQILENAFQALFEQAPDNLHETVDEALIRSAFSYCEKNQVQTAKLLGLSRNILRHRLKRYGMLASA